MSRRDDPEKLKTFQKRQLEYGGRSARAGDALKRAVALLGSEDPDVAARARLAVFMIPTIESWLDGEETMRTPLKISGAAFSAAMAQTAIAVSSAIAADGALFDCAEALLLDGVETVRFLRRCAENADGDESSH
jgi:hypothetical protein